MEIVTQKAKNVNNYILVGLFVFSNVLFAQKKIEGNYCIEYALKESSSCVIFKSEGTFERINSGDVGVNSYGKGHYLLSKDSLVLKYDLTELTEDTYHRWKKYENLEDSIQIRVKLIDFEPNYIGTLGLGSLQDRKGVIFNENGIATLRLKKEMNHKKIFISNLEYGNYDIPVYGLYSYDIDVYLKPLSKYRDAMKIRSETPIKYRIIKWRKDYFVVEREDGVKQTFRRLETE